eukprot:2259472-Amphidinium_carterae.1
MFSSVTVWANYFIDFPLIHTLSQVPRRAVNHLRLSQFQQFPNIEILTISRGKQSTISTNT